MKDIWLTTDTHFLHDKLTEISKRPEKFSYKVFTGLQRIPDKDVLIHLGDISLGKELEVYRKFIRLIRCTKILVKGNHDRKSNNWYLEHGWNFVCHAFWDTYFGKKILFSHFPKPTNDFDFNIFGHMHNDVRDWNKVSKDFKPFLNEKHILLAIEETGYQPVKLKYVVDKIEKFRLINILGGTEKC